MRMQETPKQGSFGLPAQHQKAIQDHLDKKEEQEKREKAGAAANEEAPPVNTDSATSSEEKAAEVKEANTDPKELLKGIGVELDEDDLHNLFFRGFIEKTVKLAKLKTRTFNVKYKTLIGQEYNQVDELVADDIDNVKMTRDGYERRRNLWILSFCVQELSDRPLVKVTTDDGKKKSAKDRAKGRLVVIENLAPWVIDELMRVYGVLEIALSMIVKDPEGFFSKKS